MEMILNQDFVIGSKVFFIEKGVPHTGFIKEINENLCKIEDVTFLDDILDRLHRGGIWKIKKDKLHKTGQVFLPKVPSEAEKMVEMERVRMCSTDTMCKDVDYHKYLTLCSGVKKLFSSSMHEGIYVKLDDTCYVEFKDSINGVEDLFDPNAVYHCVEKALPVDGIHGEELKTFLMIEKYRDSEKPNAVYIPHWLDKTRYPNDEEITEEMKKMLQDLYGEDVVIRDYPTLNEHQIKAVYTINGYVRREYFNSVTGYPLMGTYKTNAGFYQLSYKYFDKLYSAQG